MSSEILGTFKGGDSGVSPIPTVGFESVYFIQEVAPDHWADQGVDVLEYEETWSHATGHEEDLTNAEFGSAVATECLDVEGLDVRLGPLRDIVHQSFSGDCFAILVGRLAS